MIEYLAPPSINDAFDAYLGPYVQLERANLEQMMEGLMREEDALLRDEKAVLAHCKVRVNICTPCFLSFHTVLPARFLTACPRCASSFSCSCGRSRTGRRRRCSSSSRRR